MRTITTLLSKGSFPHTPKTNVSDVLLGKDVAPVHLFMQGLYWDKERGVLKKKKKKKKNLLLCVVFFFFFLFVFFSHPFSGEIIIKLRWDGNL